jgi:hypothetical protein
LISFAVDAVELKSLVHGFLLAIDLNRYALLVEFVLRYARVDVDEQELILFDDFVIKC